MLNRFLPSCLGCLAVVALVLPAPVRAQESFDELKEQAIKAAVKKIAPCVVQIETSGGTEIIKTGPRGRPVRKGIGPTTGLILTKDGYIISSAFNFANKPSSIIVSVVGQPEKFVAKLIATDHTRMLALLKIEAKALPVPTALEEKDILIGHTALAVGRTLSANVDEMPSVSEGIISAKGRIWGKAIQTDAKVSPTNYGGPLVDLMGRVQGVLVPASPRSAGETAGVEWYDSGIGFAIPLADIEKVLPRLKDGTDLNRGILGVTLSGRDMYAVPPKVASVTPGSGADKGGLKSGDTIVAINDKAVNSQAQLRHQLGSLYEGDTVKVKVKRDKEEKTIQVTLSSTVAKFKPIWLGILPLRDDKDPGVAVRYVYPKSPADLAKPAALKVGDRITKVGRKVTVPPGRPKPPGGVVMRAVKDTKALHTLLASQAPKSELKLEVVRKGGKKETLTVILEEASDDVPEKLPEEASAKKATPPADAPKEPETGLLKRTTPAADHRYWVYVPETYDPKVAHSVVIWLHPVGKKKDTDLEDFIVAWLDYCEDHNMILLLPVAEDKNGWSASDSEFILTALKSVTDTYTVDNNRVIAHGMGIGGQLAYYMGFHSRNVIRGVATTGASLTNKPKEKQASKPLAFFIVAGGKDPLKDSIKETSKKIEEFKYSSVYREIPNMGHQYLDLKTLEELVRWIDALDRL